MVSTDNLSYLAALRDYIAGVNTDARRVAAAIDTAAQSVLSALYNAGVEGLNLEDDLAAFHACLLSDEHEVC